MSEAAAPREWRLYVDDMVACCDKVLAYTKNLDRQGFVADPMRYDATLRNLELIGEAAPMCRPRSARRPATCLGAW